MHRREFLKAAFWGSGVLVSGQSWLGAQASAMESNRPNLPKPTPAQLRWQQFEVGLVYHFDLDVYMPGGHKHERSRRELVDPSRYNPAKLDTDQWLEAARAAGARYAIFTATHHQGFLQWQSDAYPFGLKQVAWRNGKGDSVKDFITSCHRYGIAPGLYIGIRFNAYWQVYNYKTNKGRGGDPQQQAQYMRVCEKMVEELCSRYGPLCEIWFDGGVITPEQGGPDVLSIVEKYQPDTVFYHSLERADHRWAGNEAGTAGYPCWATIPDVATQLRAHRNAKLRTTLLQHGDPDGKVWCPAMCDAPIREHDWLWRPGREDRLQPVERLVDMYYKSVGRNANLILGAVPDRDGLIPQADFKRYAEFGREIRRRFDKPVAEARGTGVCIELDMGQAERFDHAVIMEDIREGERIREYVVEVANSGGRWETICSGSSVGHKRIERVTAVRAKWVQLRITQAAARPVIKQFAVYCAS